MSTWRDIWRYGVVANRLFAENAYNGELAFLKLHETYSIKKPDGMIHYIHAHALESKGLKDKALSEYEKALMYFPVPHWQDVAKDSFDRVKANKTPEEYFNTTNFEELLWCAFNKVYDFTYLNDFARYVCLSSLARGSSEWPLSLVDFRTVIELEIKQCFSEDITNLKNAEQYSLFNIIQELHESGKIDDILQKSFNSIRIAGNIAAHNLYASDDFKLQNINDFIRVLNFFNDYCKTHPAKINNNSEYPLCQMNIKEFCAKLEEEKKLLK